MNLPAELVSEHITSPSNPPKTSIPGKILVGVTGGVALGLTVICASFVSPAFRKFCLPYIPATRTQIENISTALKGHQRGKLLDLGSGDGRIVLEMARNGFEAEGVELNLWLVLYSRIDALRKGLAARTQFHRKDLWRFPLGEYDHIVIFGVEQMMADLEKKLEMECKNGCNIVACRFPLPNRAPMKVIGHGIDTVWLYQMRNDNK